MHLTAITLAAAPLAIGTPGIPEMIIILVVGLLIFGKRLPEVARNMGRGITEFKRGIKDEPSSANGSEDPQRTISSEPNNTSAPAFEPNEHEHASEEAKS